MAKLVQELLEHFLAAKLKFLEISGAARHPQEMQLRRYRGILGLRPPNIEFEVSPESPSQGSHVPMSTPGLLHAWNIDTKPGIPRAPRDPWGLLGIPGDS